MSNHPKHDLSQHEAQVERHSDGKSATIVCRTVGMAMRVGMMVTSGMTGMVMRVVCHTPSFSAKIRMNCH
jgi:hypothetical protein